MITQVVVTGACGYIGSVMCARLSELGYGVIAVDNKVRGLNDPSKLPHVTFIQRDCREGLVDILKDYQPKGVFHFAAATGDLSRPKVELEELNVTMTQRLFEETIEHTQAHFLFPTTSLALGVPDSTYVQTKEAAIRWLQEHQHAGRTILFRFFNNSGAYRGFSEIRQNEVHIIPTMWRTWVDRTTFVINGDDWGTHDGTPAREYVHVLDTVDFLIYCWGLKRGNRLDLPRSNGLIEVGSGVSHTVRDVINQLIHATGQIVVCRIGPRRAFDVGSLKCSNPITYWRPLKDLSAMLVSEMAALNAFYNIEKGAWLETREL